MESERNLEDSRPETCVKRSKERERDVLMSKKIEASPMMRCRNWGSVMDANNQLGLCYNLRLEKSELLLYY